jgi:uncharacterized membrane protein HdeD (DUF308 family)
LSGTLSKAWWLLALCGILDAMHASINLLMISHPLTYRIFGSSVWAVWDMGLLALVAGACTIAAGLWSGGKDHSWLLSIHGLALGAFGVIAVSPLVKGPLSFRPISVMFTVMAASIGVFALANAQSQRRGSRGRWFLIGAGAASISFACSFIAVGFFLRLGPQMFFTWMSSYFVLCAVFMLSLAFRVYSRATGQSDQMEPLSPLPSPRHAH